MAFQISVGSGNSECLKLMFYLPNNYFPILRVNVQLNRIDLGICNINNMFSNP